MIWLYAVFILMLCAFLILFIPVHIIIEYTQRLKIQIGIWHFKFKIYPMPPAENKKPLSKKESPAGSFSVWSSLKKKGIINCFKLFLKIFKMSGEFFTQIFRRVTLHEVDFVLKIGSSDASLTAINYGRVCGAVYPLKAFVFNLCSPKKQNVLVTPDFDSEKTSLRLRLDISAKSFYIVVIVLAFAIKLRKLLKFNV